MDPRYSQEAGGCLETGFEPGKRNCCVQGGRTQNICILNPEEEGREILTI